MKLILKSAKTELPPLLRQVLVFTKNGERYIAARYQATKNDTKWGLIFQKRIIGVIIDNVESWSYFYNEELPGIEDIKE